MEFQFGDWVVSPEANIVSNGDAKTQLEPRVMAVLRYLCRHPGAVIPAEEILQACWGSSELGDNPVHKAITQLRRAFGDSSTEPRYIETIRKRGYRAIAPVVTFAAPPSTVWEGGSPFRGLEAFQENHAAIFFGRVQATAQLRDLVMTQAAHGCPMALVLGPSGSGKTSLVRAGLLPQLMAGATRSDEPVGLASTVYLDCADLGSGTLFQALAGALIDADINGEPLFPGASADSLGQRLASDPDGIAAELRSRGCPRVMVGVFVDRLEAVFRAQPEEADRFLGAIDALAKSNCLLMLMACRNDFYPEVMAQPVLLALKACGGHFDLLPPGGADIAQIVRQPAIRAGLTFEKDETTGASLYDVLCDAARGNADMLPLLQYTLNELYRLRTDDSVLKFEVYKHLGGIEGAVGVRAEQVVSSLNLRQINSLPHVLSLLVNISEDQGSVTSRRSPLSMLRSEDERDLVRVMVEARLFVSELAGDVPSFGVAHEALLRRWPRVVEWIERHRTSLQLRTRISGQALRWKNAGRKKDLLVPRGSQVSQASELLELRDFSLDPLEQEFVRASVNRARFAQRFMYALTGLIAVLALLTTIFAMYARSAQEEAERNRNEAEGLMTFMLGDFVEKLKPIGRLDLLDDVGNKALAYVGKTDAKTESLPSLISRLKALRIIAEVNGSRGRTEQYRKALMSARELIQASLPTFPSQPELLKEAGYNAFHFGQLAERSSELEKARQYFTEYLALSTRFAATTPHVEEGWLDQSFAHDALGTLAMRNSDYATAKMEFTASLELKRKAGERRKTDESMTNQLATTVSWYAESILKSGNPVEAMRLYRQEEELLRTIHGNNAATKGKLASSMMRQALLSVALGERDNAIRILKQAEPLAHALFDKDPTNRTWHVRLLTIRGRLAELELTAENAAIQFAKLEEVCEQLNRLREQDPKNTILALQTLKLELGRTAMLFALKREKAGLENVDYVIRGLEKFHQTAGKDKTALSILADALLLRSDFTRKIAIDSDALNYCRRTAELLRTSSAPHTDLALVAAQIRANLCIGDTTNVTSDIMQLQKLGYREERYLQYISTHPSLKGKL
jgi:DNA-binding winged helix-turn-helix (wHTH) protein/tetratricopeptide (TPR) repeat protein